MTSVRCDRDLVILVEVGIGQISTYTKYEVLHSKYRRELRFSQFLDRLNCSLLFIDVDLRQSVAQSRLFCLASTAPSLSNAWFMMRVGGNIFDNRDSLMNKQILIYL